MNTRIVGKISLLGMWLALIFATQSSALGQTAPAPAVTLIYSGNLDGELEPCGCSAEGDFGGLRRRATLIERVRTENPDAFVLSAGGLISGFAANGHLTNEYILKGFALLGYDAIGLQWNDLQYGDEFLKEPALPWVASNWHDDQISHERLVSHGGHTLAFFTWLDPKIAPQQNMLGDHSQVVDDAAALRKAVAQAKRDGAVTVLTTTLPLKDAQQFLPLQDIDVLMIRAKYEIYGDPQLIGKTLVLQAGSRGMRIGRVDLELDGQGKIAKWHHQVIPLPKTVPNSPRLEKWYAEYNAHVKENYRQLVALRKAQADGKTPFVGAEACKECHDDAYAAWSNSHHSKAFSALEDVNKSFDPDCLQCHTVGFNKPGGFIDMDATASLINVQCESCHGAAREHVASGGSTPVANDGWKPEEMCAQCHTQPHSPSFDFNQYWPRIAHQ